MRAISRTAYHIYTDGSRNMISRDSGAAAIIRRNNHTLAFRMQYTGKETVNYAELHAILLGLQWIRENRVSSSGLQFHFWIDSEYAFKLLTETNTSRVHFFIVQDIFQLASHLNSAFKHSFSIHRISSHVELFSAGACRIEGSIEADRRAQDASKQIAPFVSIENIRARILNHSAQLLQRISGLIYDKTAGPSDGSEESDPLDDLAQQLLPRARALHCIQCSLSKLRGQWRAINKNK